MHQIPNPKKRQTSTMAHDPDDPYLNPARRFRQLSRAPSEAVREYRGVFEEDDPPTGYVELKVVDSEKRLRMRVTVAEADATDAFRDNLCAWLDKKDPMVVLRVI